MQRLTKKSIGNFKYDLKDHEHIIGEFATYDAFFNYSMAVKRLGEYEDTGLTPEEFTDLQSCLEDEAGTGGAGAIGLISDLIELMKFRKSEAEGRLIKAPCKVGDTLYVLCTDSILETIVDCIQLKVGVVVFTKNVNKHGYENHHWFRESDIGKTVFLTQKLMGL